MYPSSAAHPQNSLLPRLNSNGEQQHPPASPQLDNTVSIVVPLSLLITFLVIAFVVAIASLIVWTRWVRWYALSRDICGQGNITIKCTTCNVQGMWNRLIDKTNISQTSSVHFQSYTSHSLFSSVLTQIVHSSAYEEQTMIMSLAWHTVLSSSLFLWSGMHKLKPSGS